ncbi:MAG TPA: class I SAM-dependent methyltransferase [Archangium sp.]|nr:class I SAM-dependent methyltransferase [Archangium sp.]
MSDEVEYDAIAGHYQQSKLLPFRVEIERYSLFERMGDLRGKRILDLACGEGIYSREMKRRGAATVHGVDLSTAMIELALQAEQREPLGCTYQVCDVAQLGKLGDFDLVVGCYLLNYARTREQLLAFCRAIRRNLAPGARFVSINDNPRNAVEHFDTYRPYGFIKQLGAPRMEGAPIVYTMFNPDGTSFQFTNYDLAPETYEWAFREAGFSSFEWLPLKAQHGSRNEVAGYWRHFLDTAPITLMEARV